MNGLRLSLAFLIGMAPLGACPNITFVNPVAAGSPATLVTVIGSNFGSGGVPQVVVVSPPTSLTTQLINPTELIITVPSSLTLTPGNLQIQDLEGVCPAAPGTLQVVNPPFGRGFPYKTSNPAGGVVVQANQTAPATGAAGDGESGPPITFHMDGPAADLQYTMYAYDGSSGALQQYDLDMRPSLPASPTGAPPLILNPPLNGGLFLPNPLPNSMIPGLGLISYPHFTGGQNDLPHIDFSPPVDVSGPVYGGPRSITIEATGPLGSSALKSGYVDIPGASLDLNPGEPGATAGGTTRHITIDPGNGNLYFCDSDLSSNGLRMRFCYSSEDTAAGSLGQGWRLALPQISSTGPQSLNILAPDGQRIPYVFNGTAWIPAIAGVYESLQQIAPNNFNLTTRDQTVINFQGGLWFKTTDANGNSLTPTYAAGQLTQIANSLTGQTLQFTYSGGNLSQVQDLLGRTMQFNVAGNVLS